MSSRRALINAAGTVRAALARASQQQQQQAAAAAAAAASVGATSGLTAAAAAAPWRSSWTQNSLSRAFAADASAGDKPAPSLLSVLKREIKHEKGAYAPPAVVAAGPPAPFVLVDAPGEAAVSLRREFRGGETVTVDCSVNLQDALGPPPGFEDEEEEGSDDDEEEGDDGKDKEGGKGGDGEEGGDGDGDDDDDDEDDEDPGDVAFNVTVSKGAGGPSLVFECVSDGTYVDVRHVALDKAGKAGAAGGASVGTTSGNANAAASAADDDSLYSGPVFDELDEELQDAFRGYLEARGVDEDLGEYLRWLLVDKEQREYTAWLEGVKGFVGEGNK